MTNNHKRASANDRIKRLFTKWWFWIVVTVIFLSIVQILFRIEAPCKWLDAVWEAGDLISLVGTLVLGYIAVLQTQRANDMAAEAANTSNQLIALQKAEYTPVVTIRDFTGITKHTIGHGKPNTNSEVLVHVMRCTDGDTLAGYSVSLVDQDCDVAKPTYCRNYEIHLSYSGHFVVQSFQVKEIRFSGNDFERVFEIENNMEMSLGNGQNFDLFLFLICNDDFEKRETVAYQYIDACTVSMEIEMTSVTGEVFAETIKIRKILVDNPSQEIKLKNAELLVGSSYQMRNLAEQ